MWSELFSMAAEPVSTTTEQNVLRWDQRDHHQSFVRLKRVLDTLTEHMPQQDWRLLASQRTTTTTDDNVVSFEAAIDEPSAYWRVVEDGSRWHAYVAGRLRKLAEHAHQPDRPSLETLNLTWSIIDRLLPPSFATPSVLPSEDGGVELFWQKGGWDIQVEIDENGDGAVWTRDRNSGDDHYGSLRERREELLDVLRVLSTD